MINRALIVALTMLTSITLSAQKQDSFLSQSNLKVGGGYAFLGSGDAGASTFNTEFTHTFHRLISASAEINSGFATSGTVMNHNAFFAFTAKAFISPFGNDGVHNLKLGVGPSHAFTTHSYYRTGISTVNGDTEYFDAVYDEEWTTGYVVELAYELSLNERITLGVKGNIYQYQSGYNILSSCATIGFRL